MTRRQLAGTLRATANREATFLRTLNFLLAGTATREAKALVNLGTDGLALQGYDPVALLAYARPMMADAKFRSSYHSAVYQFVSEETKNPFDQKPCRYEPQFGGYCALSVSRGHLVTIAIEAFRVVNGRLLLFHNRATRDKFDGSFVPNLTAADKTWPWLVITEGKPRRS